MKKLLLLSLLLSAFFGAFAATQKFNPVIDGYVIKYGDGSNFTYANMEVKKSTSFAREIFLSFDITTMNIDGKSAILRLYCNNYDKNGTVGISVDGFEGTFTSDLIWSTKEQLPVMVKAGEEEIFSEEQINTYYEWNVSPFVKAMIDKGVKVFSFRLHVTTGNDALLKFNTSRTSYKPELLIDETEYNPVVNSIELPKVFDSHMVLQRGKKVSVWGKANPQKELTLNFNGQEKIATTDENGNWRIELDEMAAGGAYEMKIACDDDEIVFTDVMIGDVYLAGGQSNMAFRVASLTEDARAELAQDIDYPNIRYFDVARIISGGEFLNEKDRPWTVCKDSRIDEWSAVATYFARQIHKEEGVAIGIVGCNHGGSTADAWVSPAAYAADPALDAAKVDPYTTILQYYCNPSTLYEAMLKKVAGYSLKGFIWYQGEANSRIADRYETIFTGLIKDWRNIWNDDSLPFIFAQLSTYKPTDDPEGNGWAFLREAQLNTWTKTPNTAMVVTIDVGELADIHPKDKKTVGARFALAANKIVYGKNIESSGPVFENITFSGNKAIVSFSHAENGLQSTETNLSEFEICGDDYLYKPASAKIENGKVTVWSDAVSSPVAVRYAWRNGPEPTLYNTEGLPASPFRSMVEPQIKTQNIAFEDFTVYSSASYPNREAKYAFNGDGMNSDGLTHNNAVNNVAWLSSVGKVYPYNLKVKFNEPENVEKIKIWNFNWTAYVARGMKDFDIYYSTSSDDLSGVAFTDPRWKKSDSYILPIADGTNGYLGETYPVDFQENVLWVAFNIRSCHDDPNGYVGVSEIQFFRGNTVGIGETPDNKDIMQLGRNRVVINNVFNSALNFGIFDFTGRSMRCKLVASGETLDMALDYLPKSIYLLHLYNGTYSENKKIMVQ